MSKKFTGFEKLAGVHPQLKLLIERGRFGCPFGFKVIEGVRSKELQQQYCLLYTSPSPRDATLSRMPSSA